jgi:hypothetical protein
MLLEKELTGEYEKHILHKASQQILRRELRSIEDAIPINRQMGEKGSRVVQELMAKKEAIERILPEIKQ